MPDDWFSANAPSAGSSQSTSGAPPKAPPQEDWFAANMAQPEPEKSGGEGALAAAGLLGTTAASLPAIKAIAERVATSPALSRYIGVATRAAGPLNLGSEAFNVLTGRKSPVEAAKGAIKGELLRRGAQGIYRAATPVATALGAEGAVGAAPLVVPAAGGLAGLAGTAGFLGALQHDANRRVDIDYTKNTPDTAIARVFSDMATSEANRGKTVDERMDDPSDQMFRADDSVTVGPADWAIRDAVLAKLRGGAP